MQHISRLPILFFLFFVSTTTTFIIETVSAGSPTAHRSSWRPIPFVPSASLWQWRHSSKSQAKKSARSLNAKSKPLTKRERLLKYWENLTAGHVKPGPRVFHQLLYWITAADAVQSVLLNEYRHVSSAIPHGAFPSVYSKLFYFARLRPRLLYAVGALLRALQLCTPVGRILDPTIGVGAGINFCAIIASSRWVKPLILGFCSTKFLWKWLGARRVSRAFLPITLSIREWEDKTKDDPSEDDDD